MIGKQKVIKKFTLIIVHKTDLLGPHMRPGLAFISTVSNSVLIAYLILKKNDTTDRGAETVKFPTPLIVCVICVHVVNLRYCHLRLTLGRASQGIHKYTHHRDIEKSSDPAPSSI
jgi:hypothetical protein